MPYISEVHVKQKYNVNGEIFEITEISCANIETPEDYIIVVFFENDKEKFQTNIETVLREYQLVNP